MLEALSVLKDTGTKKPITLPKHVFHIRDDDNKEVSFSVRPQSKEVQYTIDDIDKIMSACIIVLEDALKRGESVSIQGFGSIGVIQRKATRAVSPNGDGEWYEIPAHYVPKMKFAKRMQIAVKLYDIASKENDSRPEPMPEEEDDWEGEE